jgi:hypothetical protein
MFKNLLSFVRNNNVHLNTTGIKDLRGFQCCINPKYANQADKIATKLANDFIRFQQNGIQIKLETLIFRNSRIGENGVKALATMLKTNSSIKKLAFVDNPNFKDTAAIALAEALKENKTITHLCVRNNRIGDRGATALANAIKENINSSILYLDMRNNIISQSCLLLLRETATEKEIELCIEFEDHCDDRWLNIVDVSADSRPLEVLNNEFVRSSGPSKKQKQKRDQLRRFNQIENLLRNPKQQAMLHRGDEKILEQMIKKVYPYLKETDIKLLIKTYENVIFQQPEERTSFISNIMGIFTNNSSSSTKDLPVVQQNHQMVPQNFRKRKRPKTQSQQYDQSQELQPPRKRRKASFVTFVQDLKKENKKRELYNIMETIKLLNLDKLQDVNIKTKIEQIQRQASDNVEKQKTIFQNIQQKDLLQIINEYKLYKQGLPQDGISYQTIHNPVILKGKNGNFPFYDQKTFKRMYDPKSTWTIPKIKKTQREGNDEVEYYQETDFLKSEKELKQAIQNASTQIQKKNLEKTQKRLLEFRKTKLLKQIFEKNKQIKQKNDMILYERYPRPIFHSDDDMKPINKKRVDHVNIRQQSQYEKSMKKEKLQGEIKILKKQVENKRRLLNELNSEL